MSTAVVVRSMLGVSPSVYQSARETLGAEGAAATIACILEWSAHINSAGGYLRNLSPRAARDEFTLGPIMMVLARKRAWGRRVPVGLTRKLAEGWSKTQTGFKSRKSTIFIDKRQLLSADNWFPCALKG